MWIKPCIVRSRFINRFFSSYFSKNGVDYALTDLKDQNVLDIIDEKTQDQKMVFEKPVHKETSVGKKDDVEKVEDPIFCRAIVDEITVSDDDIEVVT